MQRDPSRKGFAVKCPVPTARNSRGCYLYENAILGNTPSSPLLWFLGLNRTLQARAGSVDAAIPGRGSGDPVGREGFPVPGAFRRGIQRLLQVQQEAARRLPQHPQLRQGLVPELPGGLRVYHRHGPHQGKFFVGVLRGCVCCCPAAVSTGSV